MTKPALCLTGFLVSVPYAPVLAQSAEGGVQTGPLVVIAGILLIIIVGSAFVIRRFQFATKAKSAPVAPEVPANVVPLEPQEDVTSSDNPSPTFEEEEAARRKIDRLSVVLSDTQQSLTVIDEKLKARHAETEEQLGLLDIAKRQHDVAFQEIQATRGLLDFHKNSLKHMGEADSLRRMELENAIREASRAVIKTDKEQAEREERIRTHQSRIADLQRECEYLDQEQDRLQAEAQYLSRQINQLQPRQAA